MVEVRLPPPATGAPATPTVAPTASVARSVEPIKGAQIGDTTCDADDQCAITTKHECCDCCAGEARATSAAWLAWRDGTMVQVHPLRAGAPPAPVARVEPVKHFQARCLARSCQLVRN